MLLKIVFKRNLREIWRALKDDKFYDKLGITHEENQRKVFQKFEIKFKRNKNEIQKKIRES